MTRLLLINAVESGKERSAPYLGNLYLASYLRFYGGFKNIKILNIDSGIMARAIVQLWKPDIIGLSSVTQNFRIARWIAYSIKNAFDIPVIVGGHHITALPNCLSKSMDIAVLGEGEKTLLDLVQNIEQYGLNKLNMTKGIAYRDHGKLKVTPKRKLIEPLDKIPFPARDLIGFKSKTASVLTSRGCPYNCVFCSSASFWGSVRFFSARYVVSELEHLIENYKVRQVNFCDDLFIAHKARLKEISALIKKRGIHKELRFRCTARSNLVDDTICESLKAMNVRTVSLGLESANPRQLRFLKGDNVTVEQNTEAIKTLKHWGFSVSGTFIIGGPDETRAEIEETYQFILRAHLDGGDTYVLLPYPGTRLWQIGKDQGILRDNMNWDRFEIYFLKDPYNRVILHETLSREELKRIMKKFKWLWRVIRFKAKIGKGLKHPLETTAKILRRIT